MRKRATDEDLIKVVVRLRWPSVYRLAKTLDRPYRRVLSRVRTLADAGHLQLVLTVIKGRTVIQVRQPESKKVILPTPFPVTWSRPDGKVPIETEIAALLMRPSFAGLLEACQRFGLTHVEQTAHELAEGGNWNPRTRDVAEHVLRNLRIGRDRAVRRT